VAFGHPYSGQSPGKHYEFFSLHPNLTIGQVRSTRNLQNTTMISNASTTQITSLPNELFLQIFSSLPKKDLNSDQLVSKHWRYCIPVRQGIRLRTPTRRSTAIASPSCESSWITRPSRLCLGLCEKVYGKIMVSRDEISPATLD